MSERRFRLLSIRVQPSRVAAAAGHRGVLVWKWSASVIAVALDPGAAVNAVMTATEAKAQALADRGVPGTGTATDAVIVVWPEEGAAERFAGPRSQWGSRIGRAVYQAVWAGSRAWSMSPPVTGSTPGVVP